ncbi:hypothetical protein RND81_14G182500 [Saponaria officinalis]|uniref:Uncharacterized protein n=1 Tax=Saponaria officinalis TaxID=3572 RepID=A0AAW1GZ85_SAPOF
MVFRSWHIADIGIRLWILLSPPHRWDNTPHAHTLEHISTHINLLFRWKDLEENEGDGFSCVDRKLGWRYGGIHFVNLLPFKLITSPSNIEKFCWENIIA